MSPGARGIGVATAQPIPPSGSGLSSPNPRVVPLFSKIVGSPYGSRVLSYIFIQEFLFSKQKVCRGNYRNFAAARPAPRAPVHSHGFSLFFHVRVQAQNSRNFFFCPRPETAAGGCLKTNGFWLPSQSWCYFYSVFHTQKERKHKKTKKQLMEPGIFQNGGPPF